MFVVMEKELSIAKQLAVAAGRILMDYYEQAVLVDWKAPGDPVTAADRAANEFIVTSLAREFPSHGILSEEEADDFVRLERSEERRVGKECRSRWWRHDESKKMCKTSSDVGLDW